MRQVISSGSVKAIWLNRGDLLGKLQQIAGEALIAFPEIIEIRLFGSLARGDHTGLSDADIFILTGSTEPNPLERMKPYFVFFSERSGIAVDIIAATPQESEDLQNWIKDSVILAKA